VIRHRSRRAWLAGTGCLIAASGFTAQAQTPPAVSIAGGSTEGLCEAYYAEELGLFRSHGLNASVRILASAAPMASAVASGDLNIGTNNVLSVGQAVARNIPFVIIASAGIHDKRFPNSEVVVAKQSPIQSPKDLSGKSVGVSTLSGLEALSVKALIDQAGGDLASVKFVEMGARLVPEAIVSGRIDAGVLAEPDLSANKDRTRSLGSGDDAISAHTIQTAWYCLRPWLDANKDTARRFADAIYAAGDWANKNPEKAALVLKKYIAIDEPHTYAHFAPKQDVAGIQVVFDAAAKYKFMPPISAADCVWDGK
jgi:ABC-type nitrate/sulfonate/bicarbonate transport system substrate-binding protein